MGSLIDFINDNAILDESPLVAMVTLGIIFFVCVDFLHILFSAVLSWFKR